MRSLDELIELADAGYEDPVPQEDSLSLHTRYGVTGDFTAKLHRQFPVERRRILRQVAVSGDENCRELQGFWYDLQRQLEKASRELIEHIQEMSDDVPEVVNEALGVSRGEHVDDEEATNKTRFFSKLKTPNSKVDYARRMAQFLRLHISFLDSARRARCGVTLSDEVINIINTFFYSSQGPEDIRELVLAFLKLDDELAVRYNSDVFCLLPIAQLISNTDSFTGSETAQKTVSSLKFFCRGCVLLETEHGFRSRRIQDLLKCLECRRASLTPFASLARFHKGVNAIGRHIMDRVSLTFEGKILVDGIDFSPRKLGYAIQNVLKSSKTKVRELLLGFSPRNIDTPLFNDQGRIPFCAFGREAPKADGNNDFLRYVYNNPSIQRTFFFSDDRSEGTLKTCAAKRFLKLCLAFEKEALFLIHLLTGATSRGGDFDSLTFRNGAGSDLPRRISIFDSELLLVERHNRKCEYSKRKTDLRAALLPRKHVEHIMQYWLVLRPFCCFLAKHLRRKPAEIERWQRFCFVKGSNKYVTNVIPRLLCIQGANFQRLRHASESIFRHKIAPKEFATQVQYDYDYLLGHTKNTGLCYATESLFGSDAQHDGTDITSVSRCLKEWWKVVSLDDDWEHVLRDNEESDTDGDSIDSSTTESSEGESFEPTRTNVSFRQSRMNDSSNSNEFTSRADSEGVVEDVNPTSINMHDIELDTNQMVVEDTQTQERESVTEPMGFEVDIGMEDSIDSQEGNVIERESIQEDTQNDANVIVASSDNSEIRVVPDTVENNEQRYVALLHLRYGMVVTDNYLDLRLKQKDK
jgi:hypothetical protein